MTLDTVARRATIALHSAVSDADIDRALDQALDPPVTSRRRSRLAGPLLVTAAVVLVLAVGWMGSRVLDERSAPPLDPGPSEIVGTRLSVPVEVSVPEGWSVRRDAQAVELRPMDGSAAVITLVGQPVKVFEPPDYQLKPLRDDLVVWTTTHDYLNAFRSNTHAYLGADDQFGQDGLDSATTGIEVTLSLLPKTQVVPLIPLPGRPKPLTITNDDQTFLWDVIYLTDSPPLVIASRSSVPNDAALRSARDELLQSLVITSSPTSQESS